MEKFSFIKTTRLQKILKNIRTVQLLLFVVLLCIYSVSPCFAVSLEFSDKELNWLEKHPVIRVAPDPDFPPIEYFDGNGQYLGIAADYLKRIEVMLPVKFQVVQYENWDEVLKQITSRNVDMLGAATPTPDRLKYLRFTQSYVKFPAVVLMRKSNSDFPTLSELGDRRVAVVSNYVEHEHMTRTYPNVSLVVMPDISSGLRQVAFGRVDAMVSNLASASYYIQKEGITNLQITQDTDFIADLSFGVRSDWPELVSIIEKAIDAMDRKDRKTILDKWVALSVKPWSPSPVAIVSIVVLLLITCIISVLYWNRMLQKQVLERTADLELELDERVEVEREKNRLQEQVFRAKKMEALGMLAGGVAHDLNNILTGAVGYAELALTKVNQDDEIFRYLEEIRGSGKRAGAVVADLLTISRDTAANRSVVKLNDLLQEYGSSPEHLAIVNRFPGVAFKIVHGIDTKEVACSVVHVKKTIMNLVLNGAEATQKGVVEVRTSNVCKLDSTLIRQSGIEKNSFVMVSVVDNGPGISDDDIERIFEPFYTKKKMGHSGTGLGLAIVWNTVNEHGGWVEVKQLNPGTRFDLYFPVTDLTSSKDSGDKEHIDIQGAGEFVLVIDDEEQVRDIACTHLQNLGYTVASVSNGDDAIAFLQETPVDLLLLDMIMEPGMSGYRTYKNIIKIRPNQKAIIASGFSESSEVKRAQALGAGAYIMKPYTVRELGLAIKRELNRE